MLANGAIKMTDANETDMSQAQRVIGDVETTMEGKDRPLFPVQRTQARGSDRPATGDVVRREDCRLDSESRFAIEPHSGIQII